MNKVSAFFKNCWSNYVDFMGKYGEYTIALIPGTAVQGIFCLRGASLLLKTGIAAGSPLLFLAGFVCLFL